MTNRPPRTKPTTDERDFDVHPSWVTIRANRVSCSPPGQRLFDSSIPHQHYVQVTIAHAHRKRDLHRDWIYSLGTPIMELSMSMAQWGAFVSSFGDGSGVPVTLEWTEQDGYIPQEAHTVDSRLAVTANEVKTKTADAIADVQAAEQAVQDAFERNAGRKELRELLDRLHHKIRNMPGNAKFAADSLTEHTEAVVTKARFDIEAMVSQHAKTLGIDAAPLIDALAIEAGATDE